MSSEHKTNVDHQVVQDFGAEWSRFDQTRLSGSDQQNLFNDYFRVFPWANLPPDSVGADIGCGSGRWAVLAAPRVGHLHLVDPSAEALNVARQNLKDCANTTFHERSVDNLPFAPASLDFAYSLGVLHHVPDTHAAMVSIRKALKPGAPFLIYLYYAFDQRPWWFLGLWKVSDMFRRVISLLPNPLKNFCCDVIAVTAYVPLSRTAWLLDKMGILPASWPLAAYRNMGFYVLRTDALDRFGTRLEQRFSRGSIQKMLTTAGFEHVEFSTGQPFWCAVGFTKK
ncbi:MAG: class I SAM-dependent methyltransferase [Polaromonas sp.]|uniref:class I SAM-dependent methyltransferase n=1 Tax=Polaromonas sp. TaxID=1869339 RepID=UPI0025F5E3DD|nr:class I SAM-dependent methyltransferase [Polaromonas sp.]MBI2727714.1 class I SAM-dependent methyltransferase [Polaromonas sp.]